MNEVTHIARFQAALPEFNPEVGRGCRVFLIFTNARGKMVVETSRRITGADKSVGRLRTTRDEDLDYMCLVGHIDPMKTIEIPIRELHARTGHFVRKAAADMRVIITDRGRPVAQLQSLIPQ